MSLQAHVLTVYSTVSLTNSQKDSLYLLSYTKYLWVHFGRVFFSSTGILIIFHVSLFSHEIAEIQPSLPRLRLIGHSRFSAAVQQLVGSEPSICTITYTHTPNQQVVPEPLLSQLLKSQHLALWLFPLKLVHREKEQICDTEQRERERAQQTISVKRERERQQ